MEAKLTLKNNAVAWVEHLLTHWLAAAVPLPDARLRVHFASAE